MEQHTGQQKRLSAAAARANLYALLFVMPIFVLYAVPYRMIWGRNLATAALGVKWPHPLLLLLCLGAGILLHELIHGLTWAFFCRSGLRSVRFGILWRSLTPYCHCTAPLKRWQYKTGALMPALLLGLGPALYGLATGALSALCFGFIFTLAGAGDFLIVWRLWKTGKHRP
ncbi:hypothetical protein GCM10023143_28950 [Compostibacter hankyongensis]|uniref:DUF3267 domain-containing protein n=2 Tax=Compostibacter hankyongensis TaxID=1007089 RepID=A0ABP8G422_9BACT